MKLSQLLALQAQALEAVQPERCLPHCLSLEGDELVVRDGPRLPAARVHVVALGKAARGLARAAETLLEERLVSGFLVTHEDGVCPPAFHEAIGAHPIPNERSFAAGARLLEYLKGVPREDTMLVLLSGGASALLEHPRPGVRPRAVVELNTQLQKAGLPIQEMNRRRSQLSALKGGGLRAYLPERRVTLVLCDVVGGPLEAVGSGPTAGDPLYCLADHRTMLEAALAAAPPGTLIWNDRVGGEARLLGEDLARLRCLRPTLWLGAGEPVVTVRGSGRGGRCQELTLAWSLRAQPDSLLVALSSDGQDGDEPGVAGAWAESGSRARAEALGLNPRALLEDNDSGRFFAALGQQLPGKASGTNVNDLFMLYCSGLTFLLERLRALASELDLRAYAVGGLVRDRLLGRGGAPDVDLVVEGDAAPLARLLAERLGGRLVLHERFGTASVFCDGFEVDVAGARRETYARPGALPDVEPGTLEEDLFRRDFTVNAMALDLETGQLVDPYGGSQDLAARDLRVLHDRSFQDDPTRVLRGVRLEVRLGLRMEPDTLALARSCDFSTLSRERLRDELFLCLREENPAAVLARIHALGLLPELRLNKRSLRRLRRLPPGSPWTASLRMLFLGFAPAELQRLAREYSYPLPNHFRLAQLRAYRQAPSRQHELLDPLTPEERLVLRALQPRLPASPFPPPRVTGQDLLARGWPPGPGLGAELRRLYRLQLDEGDAAVEKILAAGETFSDPPGS